MTDEPHPATQPPAAGTTAGLARRAARATALGGLVTALTPIWFAHDRVSRLRTARRPGGTVRLERVRGSAADLDRLVRSRRPVIVEGLLADLGLDGVATRDALVELAGDARLDVAFHDAERPYFLYSGGYGAEIVDRRRMSLAQLLASMFDGGIDAGSVVYQLLGPNALGGAAGRVLADFDRAISARTTLRTEPRFSGIWIGSTGVVTPLHHDAWPGLLFQTQGSKRTAVYAPRDRPNLAFRSPLHGRGRWSELPGRSGDADPVEFPRLALATRHEGVLRAGDTLVVPPFWAHEMEALEPNISVPFRFATRPSDHLDPGFLRPATELLRKQLGRRPAGGR